MLHQKNSESVGFRELGLNDLEKVSGGEIVVTAPRPDNFWVIEALRQAAVDQAIMDLANQMEGTQEVGWFDEAKDWINENLDWLASLFGYDVINPDHQANLNSELSDKTVKQVGTEHFSNGQSWDFVDTTDGQRYYDRNGDGFADLKVRETENGWQTDTGDGAGWSFPQYGGLT